MSAASWWELGIKQTLGRLRIDLGATRLAIEARGVSSIPVTMQHAEHAATLEKLHGDPFDHMLVAQATYENFRLLTRDKKLEQYGSRILCV